MPLASIHDQLRRNPKRLESMPELKRLRGGALAVPFAYHHQRWRLHLLDEIDSRAFRVHGRIVIHRGAKIRDHPLVNRIFAIVALPISYARPGDSCTESVCL